jgi:hypothetical protein
MQKVKLYFTRRNGSDDIIQMYDDETHVDMVRLVYTPGDHTKRSHEFHLTSRDVLCYVGNILKAMNRTGMTRADVFVIDEQGDAKKDENGDILVQVKNYNKVIESIKVSAEAQERYAEAKRKVILSCVESVTIDGKKQPFTADIYDADLADNITSWLLGQILFESTIQPEEVVGL